MAFRRRSFRRGRRGRPLLRWTAFSDGFETGVLEFDGVGNIADYEGVVIPLSTYQQDADLEPDGAVVTRVIADFTHLGIQAVDAGNVGTGWELGIAFIVQDVDASAVGILDSTSWVGTMVRERVLWWTQRRGTYDAFNAAQAFTNNANDEIRAGMHIHADFNVRAKLRQKLVLKLAESQVLLFQDLQPREQLHLCSSVARVECEHH